MAGVTASCKECGFMIFDEQTRTMLCDECFALPPNRRISGRAAAIANAAVVAEQTRQQDASVEEDLRRLRLAVMRLRYQESRDAAPAQQSVGVSEAELKELVEKAKKYDELQKQKNQETPHEIKSFLRKFDNLDVEGEI